MSVQNKYKNEKNEMGLNIHMSTGGEKKRGDRKDAGGKRLWRI